MKKALSLVLTMCIVLSLFATFVVSASAEDAVNLAAGKSYVVSETGGNYPDDGVKLTDGSRADNVWAGSWAGFTPNTASQAERGYAYINIDLGVVADVTKVVLHFGIDDGSGIAIPYNVSVAASEDGSTYTVVKDFVPEADKTYGAQDRSTDVEVTTRYIQIRIESYGWAFIDEVEVWGTEVEETVETKVLNLDRANHYDWTEKDYNSTQYTPTASSAGEILLAASTDATAGVGGRFGGNYFTWWYVILAEWDATANAYVVTEIDLPGEDDGKPYEAWTLGEGKIVVLCNTGYSSTDVAGNADDAAVIKEIVVGDKLTINGSDFATLAAASGALEGVSLTINAPAEEGGDEPEVIVETITVDGDLNDTGWAADGWVTVTPDNGYWQGVPESETISYKYQLRADENKLYVAVVIDCDVVEGGNGNGTNVRFWINSDEEATVYTHFYDVFKKDGAVAYNAKYNTSKTSNSGANIENSTIVPAITSADGKTYVEFSVDLAEFNGAEDFAYFLCVSNKVNENVCLYYPAVVEGQNEDGSANRLANLPYNTWYAEGEAVVDVEAIQLGEVVVEGETGDDLGDAGIYAIAALAVVALIGTAVVIKKRA